MNKFSIGDILQLASIIGNRHRYFKVTNVTEIRVSEYRYDVDEYRNIECVNKPYNNYTGITEEKFTMYMQNKKNNRGLE